MKYSVAIIGGAGYIGSSLARFFLNDFDVKVIDKAPLPEDLVNKVSYISCDIRNFDQVVDAITGDDLVINTAIIQIPLINEEKELAFEVNVLGAQNVCKAVAESKTVKGMILCGTWHVIGERGLRGLIDEEFGFRPDKVEERAKLYAMCKIMQEMAVRYYNEISEKTFGVIRLGTVLGKGMPEKTAANIFIKKGLNGENITPFSHSMYRPMFYVNINDVCQAFFNFSEKILCKNDSENKDQETAVINLYHPEPITILELAEFVRTNIAEKSTMKPQIEIVNTHPPILFSEEDKKQIKVDMTKASKILKINQFVSPKESIEKLIDTYLNELV